MVRRLAAGVAVVLGAAVLTGCVGESGRQVPSGWQEEQVGALRLAVPPDWERVEGTSEIWSDRWQLVEDGTPVAQIAVEFDVLSNGPKAGLVMQALLDQLESDMQGLEIEESDPDPLDLEGDSARVRYSYQGNDGTTYQGVMWTLGEGREQPAAVQLTGVSLDDDVVEKIGESLAFDPE